MAVFTPNFSDVSYSDLGGTIVFGYENSSHSDYVVPMAKFTFKNSQGENKDNMGPVYIRMTNSFDTVLSNRFQETEGIFGQPGNIENVGEALGTIGGSALEALKKQFVGGAGALAGFAASAGVSGVSQIEFLTRQMFNNFQQLIYKGPSFRPFNLAFNMRPTSYVDAQNMKDIISRFKIASSPKGGLGADTALSYDTRTFTTAEDESTGGAIGTKSESIAEQSTVEKLLDIGSGDGSATTSFTFGYPDMCEFEILLYADNELSTVFQSKICVIENIAVTYGSQNKLTFFDSPDGSSYFPTDVVLTLSLREAVLQTQSDAVAEYGSRNLTII